MRGDVIDEGMRVILERLVLQKQIKERWGEKRIQAAEKRLCRRCKLQPGCRLLPINFDGADCINFQPQEAE